MHHLVGSLCFPCIILMICQERLVSLVTVLATLPVDLKDGRRRRRIIRAPRRRPRVTQEVTLPLVLPPLAGLFPRFRSLLDDRGFPVLQ